MSAENREFWRFFREKHLIKNKKLDSEKKNTKYNSIKVSNDSSLSHQSERPLIIYHGKISDMILEMTDLRQFIRMTAAILSTWVLNFGELRLPE